VAASFHWWPVGIEDCRNSTGALYQVSGRQELLNRLELK